MRLNIFLFDTVETNENDGMEPMDPNEINHRLLNHVIRDIHDKKPLSQSVLVFLPGIDDIIVQKDWIEDHMKAANYKLFVLHSSVENEDDSTCSVFDTMPEGVRKIILATNIAETSITINDVVRSQFALLVFNV